MKRTLTVIMTMFALLLVASPMDAQTRKKSTTRKATTTRSTTSKSSVAKSTSKKTTTSVEKPEAIDMGLSVKWCNMDLGATNTKSAGKLYPSDVNISETMGEGWRIPTRNEFEELINSTDRQIFLDKNGVPSYVEFTSRSNGAKIKFYFPPIAAQGKSPITNPSNGIYMITPLNREADMLVFAAFKCNSAIQSKLKQVLRDYNLESEDMSKWPDEIKQAFNEKVPGIITDNKFIYMGMTRFEERSIDKLETTVRPVFQVNDED